MSEEISKGAYSRKWGLIFGLVSAIVFVITSAARINLGFAGLAVAWAIVIAMFVLGIKEFRTDNGGYVSFGQGFGIAFMIALLGGVVRAVIQYVYMIIDPEFLVWQREIQENSGFGPPRDQSQEMPEGMQNFMDFAGSAEFSAIISVLMAIFAGLIFGAVISAVLKNEADEY